MFIYCSIVFGKIRHSWHITNYKCCGKLWQTCYYGYTFWANFVMFLLKYWEKLWLSFFWYNGSLKNNWTDSLCWTSFLEVHMSTLHCEYNYNDNLIWRLLKFNLIHCSFAMCLYTLYVGINKSWLARFFARAPK